MYIVGNGEEDRDSDFHDEGNRDVFDDLEEDFMDDDDGSERRQKKQRKTKRSPPTGRVAVPKAAPKPRAKKPAAVKSKLEKMMRMSRRKG